MTPMRTPFLMIVGLAIAACGRSESATFRLHADKVERVNGCHLLLDGAPGRGEVPLAAMRFVCDVPESAVNDPNWWGEKPQPLMFTVTVGDCLLLGDTFYCVEEMGPGEASFRASYKWATRHRDRIERIR